MAKKYGLIVPTKGAKKGPVANFSRPSVFGSDSDSDEEARPGMTSLLGPGDSQKRQARLIQEKALREDPTVYQYDELYDEIETKRQEAKKSKSTEEKKPKYITKLLETAEKRKKEYERRVERQVQKEREEEGEKFKDKESFVTSAYKQKLEEMRLAEEEEKREAYLESIGDVTKQKDLDGFYRHIYEQKMGKESPKDDDGEKSIEKGIKTPEKIAKKERTYRKRKASVEEAEQEAQEDPVAKKTHIQSNIDADSDFSIDSSSESEEEKEGEAEEPAKTVAAQEPGKEAKDTEIQENSAKNDEKHPEDDKEGKETKVKDEEAKPKAKKEQRVKINIWQKRTVGEVFDAALQRYYERKAARSGG